MVVSQRKMPYKKGGLIKNGLTRGTAYNQKWSYKRGGLSPKIVFQERWYFIKKGFTRGMVSHQTWPYKRAWFHIKIGLTRAWSFSINGLTRELICQQKWSYKNVDLFWNGLRRKMVHHQICSYKRDVLSTKKILQVWWSLINDLDEKSFFLSEHFSWEPPLL